MTLFPQFPEAIKSNCECITGLHSENLYMYQFDLFLELIIMDRVIQVYECQITALHGNSPVLSNPESPVINNVEN